MKCRICGSECPPGAKLCRDCTAARKRAFAATVTMPLLAAAGVPTVSLPRFAPKPLRPSSKAAKPTESPTLTSVRRGQSVTSRDEAPPRPIRTEGMKTVRRGKPAIRARLATPRASVPSRVPVVPIVGAMMLIGMIGFIGLRTLAGEHGAASEPAEVPIAETPRVSAATAVQAPTVAAAQSETATSAPLAARTTSQPVAAPPPDMTIGPAPPKPVARKRAPSVEAAKAPPAPVAQTVAPEPLPQVAAAQARRAEVASDPLQNFNAAIARCGREDLLARMGCEQRVRVQFCGDHWGQIAQCQIGRPMEHGQ